MFKEILVQAIEARRAEYRAHRERIEARAAELNKGAVIAGYNRGAVISTEPTWGKDNRPHAPFDGYLWEDVRTGNIDAYGGGQYLPYTDDFDDINKPEYTGDHGYYYVRMTEEMLVALEDKEYSYMFSINKGSFFKLGDTMITSVKIYAPKYILDLLSKYSEAELIRLKEIEKLSKGEAPDGRQDVFGTVLNVKVTDGYYGPAIKCLIKLENGATIWGTLPKPLHVDFRGWIKMTATFERKADDNTHAYYKRPKLIEFEGENEKSAA